MDNVTVTMESSLDDSYTNLPSIKNGEFQVRDSMYIEQDDGDDNVNVLLTPRPINYNTKTSLKATFKKSNGFNSKIKLNGSVYRHTNQMFPRVEKKQNIKDIIGVIKDTYEILK